MKSEILAKAIGLNEPMTYKTVKDYIPRPSVVADYIPLDNQTEHLKPEIPPPRDPLSTYWLEKAIKFIDINDIYPFDDKSISDTIKLDLVEKFWNGREKLHTLYNIGLIVAANRVQRKRHGEVEMLRSLTTNERRELFLDIWGKSTALDVVQDRYKYRRPPITAPRSLSNDDYVELVRQWSELRPVAAAMWLKQHRPRARWRRQPSHEEWLRSVLNRSIG